MIKRLYKFLRMRLSNFVMLVVTAAFPTIHTQSVAAAPALEISIGTRGIEIDAGNAGKYTLSAPGLRMGASDYTGEKPVTLIENGKLLARYSNGAELHMSVADKDKSVTVSFTGVPATAKAFVFQLLIPIRYSAVGTFALGKKPSVAFPGKLEAQIVSDGWAESFAITDPVGGGFRITMPGDYQQVQDNRFFNWSVFVHVYNYTFAKQSNKNSFVFRFEGLDAAGVQESATTSSSKNGNPTVIVDRYGQSKGNEYPGKVRADDELIADREREIQASQPASGPKLDRYGGLADSGASYGLKKTGFFHVGQADRRQVLVTPDGNMFFQLGVCGVAITDDLTLVKGRTKIYEWLPTADDEKFTTAWRDGNPASGVFSFYVANWIRKYGRSFSPETWAAQAISRLHGWGFNSFGAFSSSTDAMRMNAFPTVAFLPLGAGGGVKVLPEPIGAAQLMDPFFPGTEEALDQRFSKVIASKAGDPLLIGYFFGNEQAFEALPKKLPAYKASQVAAKLHLVAMLREKYREIVDFNVAWEPSRSFASFDELNEEPLFVRTDAAAQDVQEFYALYMDNYYSMVTRVFRKHDPNHLLLGSRLTPATANNEAAVRASGKYSDVVSVNYYSYPIESGFLKKVHDWSGGRPVLLSEWYFGAPERGLGGGKEVKDQHERALGYRNYVEQAAALPFVVGSEWFIYGDQSITGRFFSGFNGEGNNTGLIDVVDRPYGELVNAARESNTRIYEIMVGKVKPYAYQDRRFTGEGGGGSGGRKIVAIPRAMPNLGFDGTTTNWPGRPAEAIESNRVMVGGANTKLRGDFRLCWDETSLHILIQVKDPTPQMNDGKADRLWSGDAIELFIGTKNMSQGGSLLLGDRQVLLGVGREPKVYDMENPEVSSLYRILVNREIAGDGYTVQAAIPWKILGITPMPATELLFDIAIDNSDDGHSRKQQLVWNGTAKNSANRGDWGRARIVDN